MIVKQNLSILFYHKKKKARKADGKAPIYVRVTIDGLDDEISTGIYVHPDHWENDTKTISSGDSVFKKLNKELQQMETDLERHFDLVQAKHEVATPQLVFQAYRTPLNGERQKQEKVRNLELSELLGHFCLQMNLDSYCCFGLCTLSAKFPACVADRYQSPVFYFVLVCGLMAQSPF